MTMENVKQFPTVENDPIESLPEGWKPVQKMDVRTLARILDSYADAVRDSIGVVGFVQSILSSAVFVHDTAWIAVEKVVPGGAAFIHGGKFCDDRSHVEPFRKFLDWLIDVTPATLVVAPIPERSPASVLLNDVGFVKTGFIPLDDTFDGKPVSTEIWTLFPRKGEKSEEE